MSLYLHFPFKYNNQTILDQASTLHGEIEERSDSYNMYRMHLELHYGSADHENNCSVPWRYLTLHKEHESMPWKEVDSPPLATLSSLDS
jgi:hypothetical protein